jgi:hypothetical protein
MGMELADLVNEIHAARTQLSENDTHTKSRLDGFDSCRASRSFVPAHPGTPSGSRPANREYIISVSRSAEVRLEFLSPVRQTPRERGGL